MPPTDTLTRSERLKALLEDARNIAAKAEAEGREFTEDERTDVKAKLDEAKALKADNALVGALDGFGEDVKNVDGGSVIDAAGGRTLDVLSGSIGEAFTKDPEYVEWLKKVAPNGLIPDSMKGITSPAYAVDGLKGFGYQPTGRKAPSN